MSKIRRKTMSLILIGVFVFTILTIQTSFAPGKDPIWDVIADLQEQINNIPDGSFSKVQGIFHFATYEDGTLVAAGVIKADATIAENYNIASCSWDSTYDRYVITIAGKSYVVWDYVTVVTVCGGNDIKFATTDSVMGDLLVTIWGQAP